MFKRPTRFILPVLEPFDFLAMLLLVLINLMVWAPAIFWLLYIFPPSREHILGFTPREPLSPMVPPVERPVTDWGIREFVPLYGDDFR